MRVMVNDNGSVEYIMRAGADFVHGFMTEEDADAIIGTGKVAKDTKTHNGFSLCVDDNYWFIPAAEKKSVKE